MSVLLNSFFGCRGFPSNQVDARTKILESSYLETYKSLNAGGKETVESKIIRCMLAYFHITAVQAKFNEAYVISEPKGRSIALRQISNECVRVGDIDGALAVTSYIPFVLDALDANKNISDYLVRIGDVNKAMTLVWSKHHRYSRNEALLHISRSLIRTGRIDNVMNLVIKGCLIDSSLQDISIALANNGIFDRAIKVAALISPNYERGKALFGISKALTNGKFFDRAIYIALSNPHQELKIDAFLDIICGLATNGDFDRAIELAGALWVPLIWHRDSARIEICKKLIEAGLFDRAASLAMSMRNKYGAKAFIALSKAYLKLDDIDNCIRTLLKAIQLPQLKLKELSGVDRCVHLLAAGNIEEAIKDLEYYFHPELFNSGEHDLKSYSWKRLVRESRKSLK
jgi:tetratricopeptide (TPR) repeat protein